MILALCLGAVWLAEARPEPSGGNNYRGGNSRGGYSRNTGGGGQDYVSGCFGFLACLYRYNNNYLLYQSFTSLGSINYCNALLDEGAGWKPTVDIPSLYWDVAHPIFKQLYFNHLDFKALVKTY